jgi:hypothetical protein
VASAGRRHEYEAGTYEQQHRADDDNACDQTHVELA